MATKIDALDESERLENLREKAEQDGKSFFAISSVTKQGIKELVFAIAQKLESLKEVNIQIDAAQNESYR